MTFITNSYRRWVLKEEVWDTMTPAGSSSGTWNMGFAFEPTSTFTITSLGWYTHASETQTIRLYDETATPLVSESITSNAGTWVDVPITYTEMSVGVQYIVAIGGDPLSWQSEGTYTINTNCPITNVQGCYIGSASGRPNIFDATIYGVTRFKFFVP